MSVKKNRRPSRRAANLMFVAGMVIFISFMLCIMFAGLSMEVPTKSKEMIFWSLAFGILALGALGFCLNRATD